MPMREKSRYLLGTQSVLEDSQREPESYDVTVYGRDFIVYPNVFSPKYFSDTGFFAEAIKVNEGERFLEIGPGSGVVSVTKAMEGAEVTAVDINPDAVRNTRENAVLHKVEKRLAVYQGNLYDPLPEGSVFETIFWNTPFGYVEGEDISLLQRAVYDPGYRSTEAFIRGAASHLAPNGRLLIGFSSTLGHLGKLKDLLRESGYRVRLVKQIDSEETHPVRFELFEARLSTNVTK